MRLEGGREKVEDLRLARRLAGAWRLQPQRRVHGEEALAEGEVLLWDTLARHSLAR